MGAASAPFAPARAALPLSGVCYALVWLGTLVSEIAGLPRVGEAAGLFLLLFLAREWPRQRRYARVVLLGFSAAGGIGIALSARDGAAAIGLFLTGWRRGAALAAFYFALGALRDAAETSPLFRRCGRLLLAQPPGRRYAALTVGSHLFGIILSYGAIDLLGAMVSRGRAEGAPRARRMMLAINRGFCTVNAWNPLNVMTAVVTTAVPAAPMRVLMPLGLVVALMMMALGWAEDRWRWRRQVEPAASPVTTGGWTEPLRLIGLVGLVMVLAEVANAVLDGGLIAAVTLVVPLVALVWIGVQIRGGIAQLGPNVGAASGFGEWSALLAWLGRRGRRFVSRAPAFRAEALVLGASGFMGVALGGALSSGGLPPWLGGLPPLAIPLAVPPLLMLTGQIGLNPIAVVALIGAAIPSPAALGVAPAALAFACMLGWALAVSVTPMSASAITTARWLHVSPWRVSTVWNAGFAGAALLLAWGAIGALSLAMGWPIFGVQ
jgi:hypothetical protein